MTNAAVIRTGDYAPEKVPNAAVIGTGFYVPEEILDNKFFVESRNNPYKVYKGENKKGLPVYLEDEEKSKKWLFRLSNKLFGWPCLEKRVLIDEKKIIDITGIRQRRMSAPDEFSSDMAQKAARAALENAKILPQDLEGIIIATITPDCSFPSTACIVQEKLGARNVNYAIDVAAACAGFGHALDIAEKRMKQEPGNYLVVGAETLTKITDYEEINCTLFGDGAGAVILAPAKEEKGILATVFHSITSDNKVNYIYKDKRGKLRMPEGHSVMKSATRYMIECAEEIKKVAGLSEEDVKLYIPHQANERIIKAIERKIDPEGKGKVYDNIERYGNMSSATCPIALAEAVEKGKVKEGDVVILVAFGSGLSVSGAAIRL